MSGEMPEIEIPGLKLSPREVEHTTANFDMFLFGIENEDSVAFSLEYCTRLFKPATVERFITHFKHIISSVLADPTGKLKDIELISKDDKARILSSIDIPDKDVQVEFDI